MSDWRGTVDLEPLLVEIEQLKPHPRNARRGNVDLIVDLLDEYGQLKPIVADETMTVLAGHSVLEAAKRLGWSQIAVTHAHLDSDEALGYLVADNRASDVAVWDRAQVVEVIEELDSSGLLKITGFDEEALAELRLEEPEVTCPRCGLVAPMSEMRR